MRAAAAEAEVDEEAAAASSWAAGSRWKVWEKLLVGGL
jgi:hypothetical protein